jgi:hypothetical protein
MSDDDNFHSNDNDITEEVTVIPPGSEGRAEEHSKHRGWTEEFDMALLEEIGNCGAHIPGHNQTTKCWENVTVALKARGIPFDNPRTIQRRWSSMKLKFVAKRAKEEATSGVENFGDDDDNPLLQLMEDLLDEMKDCEVEKAQKRDAKRNKEESLVAGGKLLRDKAARQILAGESVAIGGQKATLFKPSPTSSVSNMSDAETTTNPSTGSSKKRSLREHFFNEFDLLDHENKKLDLEYMKFDLESKKIQAEIELRQEEQKQTLMLHREAMEMKKQALQLQLTQHQDEMKLRFLEMEQRLKK